MAITTLPASEPLIAAGIGELYHENSNPPEGNKPGLKAGKPGNVGYCCSVSGKRR